MIIVDGRKAWCAMHFTRAGVPGVPHGFLVEPRPEGGVFIVALDGVRMVVLLDETGRADAPTVIRLEPDVTKRLRKGTLLRVPGIAEVCRDPDGPSSYATYSRAIVPGGFPNWRKVVPREGKDSTGISVDLAALASFRCLWDVPVKSDAMLPVRIGRGGKTLLLRTAHVDRFGVLATMRTTLPLDLPFSLDQGDAAPPPPLEPPATLEFSQVEDPTNWNLSAAAGEWQPPSAKDTASDE